jgi:hypothetical protein
MIFRKAPLPPKVKNFDEIEKQTLGITEFPV